MALRTFILSIALAVAASTAFAQTKKLEFRDKGISSVNALFVGEVHGIKDLPQFKDDIIRFAHYKFGINNVVLELGKSEAYLFNAFLQRGDTAILEEYGHSKGTMDELEKWKSLYTECHFTMHGIDFDRIEFVVAVRSILRRYPAAANTRLYRYLCSLPQSVIDISDGKRGAKERIRIYSIAKDIFEGEKDALKQVLSEDYTTVAGIMENPTTEKRFKQRDKGMAENLSLLRKQGDGRFLCIVGLGHTTTHKKGSLINRFVDSATEPKVMLIDMVCKNCYLTSYFGTNVHEPIIADYYGKNVDAISTLIDKTHRSDVYMLVNQKELTDLKGGYNAFPTYYAIFRDQPVVKTGE